MVPPTGTVGASSLGDRRFIYASLIARRSMPAGSVAGPVVVTGGAGAIGSWLVRVLVERGREVRIVDDLSSGRREHHGPALASPRCYLTVADHRAPKE